MKTKNLIILAVLLLGGTFVSTQTYSDSNNQKKEITQNKFQSSNKPELPVIVTSFGTWLQMLIPQLIPGIMSNDSFQSDDGSTSKQHQMYGQPARDLQQPTDPYQY